MEISGSIITGVLALCGGYLGSRWHWRYRHREWLLRERTKVFAKFLETLYQTNYEASKALANDSLVLKEKQERLEIIFNPIMDAAKIVSLLLVKECRGPFESLVRDISVAYTESALEDCRQPVITEKRKKLEGIIERHIDDPESFGDKFSASFAPGGVQCVMKCIKKKFQSRNIMFARKNPKK